MRRLALPLLLTGLLLAAPLSPTAAAQCGPARGRAGQFDYYLLSLSWAPAYCATPSGKKNRAECGPGTGHGFVVHGLWPQYRSGQWPQCCQAVAPLSPSPVTRKLSRVMIGGGLMAHEWEKHGSCVTTDQDGYFGSIVTVVEKLGLAPGLSAAGPGSISRPALKAHWAVPASTLTLRCAGQQLTEVHICLDKGLSPINCTQSEQKSDSCPDVIRLH